MAYTFVDNWIRIPDSETARTNGRTHGVTVTREGNVIILHQAHNGLLTYDPDGQLISAVGGDRWMGGHGLTRIEQGGEEFLWVVDVGSMEVAKTTLSIFQPGPLKTHSMVRSGWPTAMAQTSFIVTPKMVRIWKRCVAAKRLANFSNRMACASAPSATMSNCGSRTAPITRFKFLMAMVASCDRA